MSNDKNTLYERLGGYAAISAVANDLLPRLRADPQLGRFWAHRGEDGVMREKQLLIDYLCANAGGPMYYRGRDMKLSHRGMGITESDWKNPMLSARNGGMSSIWSKLTRGCFTDGRFSMIRIAMPPRIKAPATTQRLFRSTSVMTR